MSMSRKDYRAIADALKEVHEAFNESCCKEVHEALDRATREIGNYMNSQAGYDSNGNRRFRREQFYGAAGYGTGFRNECCTQSLLTPGSHSARCNG